MKKILGLFLAALIGFSTAVFATSVICQDGKNYQITNDYNQTRSMTMEQINQQVGSSNILVQQDGIKDLKDGEALADWMGVQQMALNAESTWQANQVSTATATSTSTGT